MLTSQLGNLQNEIEKRMIDLRTKKWFAVWSWLGGVALACGIYAVWSPVFGASAFGFEETVGLKELGEWSGVMPTVLVLNMVGMMALLFPATGVWKRRFLYPLGTGVLAVVELLGSIMLMVMKEQVIVDSGLEQVLNFLSVEVQFTGTFWLFVASAAVALVCSIFLVRHKE